MKAIKDGKAPINEGTSSTYLQDDPKKEAYQNEKLKNNVSIPKTKTKVVKKKGQQQTTTSPPKKNDRYVLTMDV